MEIGLMLEKDQEFQLNKEFVKKFCREFEQTNLHDVTNISVLKKLKYICQNLKRLDVYLKEVETAL